MVCSDFSFCNVSAANCLVNSAAGSSRPRRAAWPDLAHEPIYDRSCRTAREYIRDCGLVIPRAFQCLTIEWADLSLGTMQVSGADLHCCCTKSKSRQYATRIGDPAGGDPHRS